MAIDVKGWIEKFLNSGDGYKNQGHRIFQGLINEGLDIADLVTGANEVLRDMYDVASDDEIERAQQELNQLRQDYNDALAEYDSLKPEEMLEDNPIQTAAATSGSARWDQVNLEGKRKAENERRKKANEAAVKAVDERVQKSKAGYDSKAEAVDAMVKRRDSFDQNKVKYMYEN